MELEKSEARKLMKLRDDRISQLDATCRAMSENMMSQSVRHENEMSILRESEKDALKKLNELLVDTHGEDAELVIGSSANYEAVKRPSFTHNNIHRSVTIGGGGGSGEQKTNGKRDGYISKGSPVNTPPTKKTDDSKGKSSGSRFFGRLRFF